VELLLNLRFPPGAARDSMDVAVDLAAEATVRSLRDALTRFALRYRCLPTGTRPDQVTLYNSGAPVALDLDRTVVDTRVLSGATLRMGIDARVGLPRDVAVDDTVSRGGLALDVVAGPQAGMLVPLGAGQVTVGRSRRCEVVVRDPTLSREHLALDVGPDGSVTLLPRLDAHNGTYVDGRPVVGHRMLQLGELVHAGGTVFSVRAAVPEATRRRDQLGQVPLNRVPYQRVVVRPREFDPLRSPPMNPKGRPISVLAALSPMVMGVVMFLVLDRWYLLLMTTISPVLLIMRTIGNRRGGRRRYARERDEFFASVEKRADEIEAAMEDERRARLAAAPDLAELARQARFHQPRLWERNRDAGDALTLRLGLGPADAEIVTTIAGGGDEELREKAHLRLAFHRTVEDVPVTLDLDDQGTLGLWGEPDHVAGVGRALVIQACCLHSPEDLVVVAALGQANRPEIDWLKWLPHSRSAASPLAGDHLALGPDGARELLGKLLQVVTDRAARARSGARGAGHWPKVLLLLDEHAGHDPSLVAQLLDVAADHGIHPVWLGTSELHVPRQCRAVVACAGHGRPAAVSFTAPDLDDVMLSICVLVRTVTHDGHRFVLER
jgi:DNA segregation ATPase FtsK/SpoIIIE, S-DNA-T family